MMLVVLVVVDVVVLVVVLVVVRMWRAAPFCTLAGDDPQEASAQTATRAAPATATTRPTWDMVPLWCSGAQRVARRPGPVSYFRMLTARATTRIATTSEMASSAIIMSFAHGLTAETSVGLKAVAVAKAKWK